MDNIQLNTTTPLIDPQKNEKDDKLLVDFSPPIREKGKSILLIDLLNKREFPSGIIIKPTDNSCLN